MPPVSFNTYCLPGEIPKDSEAHLTGARGIESRKIFWDDKDRSADKRIGFSQFHLETEKATINPENPVNPVRNISLAEKTVEDVIRYFGDNLREARTSYRRFVEKGIKHGRRTDLQGGGLV